MLGACSKKPETNSSTLICSRVGPTDGYDKSNTVYTFKNSKLKNEKTKFYRLVVNMGTFKESQLEEAKVYANSENERILEAIRKDFYYSVIIENHEIVFVTNINYTKEVREYLQQIGDKLYDSYADIKKDEKTNDATCK